MTHLLSKILPLAKILPLPQLALSNWIKQAVRLRFVLVLALFAYLLNACTLPPRFTQLVAPPEGKVVVYIYKTELKNFKGVDQSVLYSINGEKESKLRTRHSHVILVDPGVLTIANLSSQFMRPVSIKTKANDTVFVKFKTIQKRGRSNKFQFGHALSIFNSNSTKRDLALEELKSTRVEYFSNVSYAIKDSRQQSSVTVAVIAPVEETSIVQEKRIPSIDKLPAVAQSAPVVAQLKQATPVVIDTTNGITMSSTASDQKFYFPDSAVKEKSAQAKVTTKITTTKTTNSSEASLPSTPIYSPSSALDPPSTAEQAWPELSGLKTIALQRKDINCKKPFPLSRGCTIFSIAKIPITIDGLKLKVSTTETGNIIYLSGAQSLANVASEFFTFAAASIQRRTLKRGIILIRQRLITQNIAIKKEHLVFESNRLVGYVFETEGDAYSVLK